MATFVFVLVCAAIVGGVFWNRKNRDAALGGVEFEVVAAPEVVAGALRTLYCDGAKAKAKSVVLGMSVVPVGASSFRYQTRIGDVGTIRIAGASGGSTVSAASDELYIGTHPKSHFRKGLAGTAAAIAHGIYKMLGIAPYASKMKRFQNGLPNRVERQLAKDGRAAV